MLLRDGLRIQADVKDRDPLHGRFLEWETDTEGHAGRYGIPRLRLPSIVDLAAGGFPGFRGFLKDSGG